MAVFVLAGVFYFAMSYPLSLLVRAIERRLSIHENAGENRR
jgi:ABC-type amino acid transport system permease subunit